MDITDNKVLCEACWTPVDSNDFGLCVSCKAPYHPECRRAEPRCPTFGCGGITLMTQKDYIAGAGRDLPDDPEARVKVLLARRQSLLDDYRRASTAGFAMGIAFFAIAGVFSVLVGLPEIPGINLGVRGLFVATLIATLAIAGVTYYLHHDTRHLLGRIALIDLELFCLDRNWDGTARPAAPAPKAA